LGSTRYKVTPCEPCAGCGRTRRLRDDQLLLHRSLEEGKKTAVAAVAEASLFYVQARTRRTAPRAISKASPGPRSLAYIKPAGSMAKICDKNARRIGPIDIAKTFGIGGASIGATGTVSEQCWFMYLGASLAEDGCMQFDDSKSGDHLETRPGRPPAVVANIPERRGVTGHNVRYVLLFGIAAVIIAFAVIFVSYFT
jgi:hypothetical protein